MGPVSMSIASVLLLSLCANAQLDIDRVPTIGILSQPLYKGANMSYIAGSYVQFVEMAGGRAVPIVYTDPIDEIERRFRSINGLIFPGGTVGLDVSQAQLYHDVAKHLYHLAHTANKNGDPFAVHGVCMGYQMMMRFSGNGTSPLTKGFDSKDHPVPLKLTSQAATSRSFGGLEMARLRNAIGNQTRPITYENHNEGVTLDTFSADKTLSSMWNVLATAADRNASEFIAHVEAKDPAVFMSGSQWHPEKPPFEYKSDRIPHSRDAILLSQHLANVLVEPARQSSHVTANISTLSIWNYAHAFDSPYVKDFELIFLFDNPETLTQLR